MITKLSIKNYALIDDITVKFNSELTIITGETGAGKSILLGALSLALGKRADLKSVRNITEKCIIEVEFQLKKSFFLSLFSNFNLDFDEHTIIRRELLPSGKSRAFVNDSPVNLGQLQSISAYLVDIHSQHETISLFSETYQMEVVDILAGNSVLLSKYSEKLKSYNEVSETISALIYKKESATKELDYNTFLFNELFEANIKGINQESLEETYEKLNNTETIQETLSQVDKLFSEEHIGSLSTLKEARSLVGKLQNISIDFSNLWNRLNSVVIELEDISEELVTLGSSVEANPSQLFEINEKLQNIYKLQQKHSVSTVLELCEIQDQLELKIEITNNLDEEISKLKLIQSDLMHTLVELSDKLHVKRKNAIPTLKNKLIKILIELGLPNADFKFELTKTTNFRKYGTNTLQLLFTANKGQEFGLLKKVASGGELSRIMLAIKSVLTQYKQLPTIVFDEIDTGISGEIAYKMAEIFKEMSLTMQMLCITHLPQIAASGNHHIKIYKEDINNITVTKLIALTNNERIKEIAEMIGGKNKSTLALKQAKELLN